jgi:hypothetical protein
MSYFPKHYITPNQYTSGGEFVYKSSQIEYIGYYWKTGNGRFYTGKTPQSSETIEIAPIIPIDFGISTDQSEYNKKISLANIADGPLDYFPEVANLPIESNIISEYANLKNIPQTILTPFKYIPQYNQVIPTPQDYQNGEFRRYFAKKTNELQYIEINQQTFALLRQKSPTIEWSLYQPFNIPWQLTGDKNQVEKTNRNIVELTIQKNRFYKFNEYLKFDYTKYYNQLGSTTSGSYINGVNQGYVLDNRNGRSTRVSNSQNDSGSVRRDSSITR